MNKRKFIQLGSSLSLMAGAPSLLAQVPLSSPSKARAELSPLNISNQDAPTPEDKAAVEAIVAAIPKTESEAIGDLYDSYIYPAAAAVTKNALRSGNADWTALFAALWDASTSLSVEGIDDLAEQLAERQRAIPKTGISAFLTDKENLIKRLEMFSAPKAEPLKPFDKGPTVDSSGCRMVLQTNGVFPSYRNYPIRYGLLTVSDAAGNRVDQFHAQTGGSAGSFKERGGPLPPGRYAVRNYRANRHDVPSMIVEDVSYSFDVDPVDNTNVFGRSLFRIHPDGGRPGTLGCVGIVGEARIQSRFERYCSQMLRESGGSFKLAAFHI